jgi:DNA/RNA endonuclease G (NUC1)
MDMMKSKIVKSLMKKNSLWLVVCVFFTLTTFAQIKEVETEIFSVVYDEGLEQPIKLSYRVQCPLGDASRSGLDFRKYDGVHTSDNNDYSNNVYDKGHLAPAAAFNCDREMVRSTFSYLNCALQHEGLNRGPWKELERFERDLAKLYTVDVVTEVIFIGDVQKVPGGATIPTGFEKTIYFDGKEYTFYFPNQDVAGQDWFNFLKFQN